MRRVLALLFVLSGLGPAASAQVNSAATPAAPVAPSVVTRDGAGHVTIRATEINEPIVLDGVLADGVYSTVRAIDGFVQQEPEEGAPATEKTDVWLLFDDRNIYVSGRCWDSHPELDVANEMRRDGQGMLDNESFARHVRHLLRPAQRLSLPDHARGRPLRRLHHRRARHEPRLEHGVGRPHGALRRRAGRSRSPFRSSRCAFATATRRSGA